VVGAGAREHALVRRITADPGVRAVLCAPGNPGIEAIAETVKADPAQPAEVLDVVVRHHVDLTVVGPEQPLAAGVADEFAAAGRLLLGPSASAARLESSKAFAKGFMERHRIPTARFRICDSADAAIQAARTGELGLPLVVKADGLAAGKGVVIASTEVEAVAAIEAAMRLRQFGAAGHRVVLEECLTGQEISFFVLTDGNQALPIGTAQDHKRIFDDDQGPNTGGMGAFAPSPLVDAPLAARIMAKSSAPSLPAWAPKGVLIAASSTSG